jgi:hypothetical protein
MAVAVDAGTYSCAVALQKVKQTFLRDCISSYSTPCPNENLLKLPLPYSPVLKCKLGLSVSKNEAIFYIKDKYDEQLLVSDGVLDMKVNVPAVHSFEVGKCVSIRAFARLEGIVSAAAGDIAQLDEPLLAASLFESSRLSPELLLNVSTDPLSTFINAYTTHYRSCSSVGNTSLIILSSELAMKIPHYSFTLAFPIDASSACDEEDEYCDFNEETIEYNFEILTADRSLLKSLSKYHSISTPAIVHRSVAAKARTMQQALQKATLFEKYSFERFFYIAHASGSSEVPSIIPPFMRQWYSVKQRPKGVLPRWLEAMEFHTDEIADVVIHLTRKRKRSKLMQSASDYRPAAAARTHSVNVERESMKGQRVDFSCTQLIALARDLDAQAREQFGLGKRFDMKRTQQTYPHLFLDAETTNHYVSCEQLQTKCRHIKNKMIEAIERKSLVGCEFHSLAQSTIRLVCE